MEEPYEENIEEEEEEDSFKNPATKVSRTHGNTILHIQGNTRHCQGNDRKEALIIILGKW
jgi:hypothetical protein